MLPVRFFFFTLLRVLPNLRACPFRACPETLRFAQMAELFIRVLAATYPKKLFGCATPLQASKSDLFLSLVAKHIRIFEFADSDTCALLFAANVS